MSDLNWLPDWFFNTKKSTRKTFTNIPGSLVPERLLEGHSDYWAKEDTSDLVGCKHLILADWSMASWSVAKTKKVITQLEKLMDAGFKISLLQDDKLVDLDKDTLHHLEDQQFRKRHQFPEDPEWLKEKAHKQKKLAADDVLILNDHEVTCLSEQDFTRAREVHISSFEEYENSVFQGELFAMLQRSTPPVEVIIVDKLLPTTIYGRPDAQKTFKRLKLLSELFPKADCIAGYKAFSRENAHQFQKQPTKTMLEQLEQNEMQISLDDLEHLETLSFNESLAFENALQIIAHSKALHMLTVSTFQELTTQAFQTISSPSLNTLELRSGDDLEINIGLAKTFPNLETLNISVGDESKLKVALDSSTPYNQLKKLSLEGDMTWFGEMAWSDLSSLLQYMPNLETLELKGNFNFSADASVDLQRFQSIRKLHFGSLLSAEAFKTLLMSLPNLEEITFDSYDGIEPGLSFEEHQFPALKKLSFGWSGYLPSERLSPLLDAAPNIEEITTATASFANEAFDCDLFQKLPRLKKLSTRSDSNGNLAESLTAHCPLLEVLSFNNTQIQVDLSPLRCPELKVLSFSESNNPSFDTTDSFRDFLSSHPNLEILEGVTVQQKKPESEGSRQSVPGFTENLPPLTNLKKVHLAMPDTILSESELLYFLCNTCPNLGDFSLSCAGISHSPESQVTQKKNANLKSCRLFKRERGDSVVPISIYRKILERASNLSSLDIKFYRFEEPFPDENFYLKNFFGKSLTINTRDAPRYVEEIELFMDETYREAAREIYRDLVQFNKEKERSYSNHAIADQYFSENFAPTPDVRAADSAQNRQSLGPSFNHPFVKQAAEAFQGGMSPIPTHHAQTKKQHREKIPKNDPLVFENKNKTLNQGMLIEKLCRYLTITRQHRTKIHKLQRGICFALATYFCGQNPEETQRFLCGARDWNGSIPTLTDYLDEHFERVFQAVDRYYFQKIHPENYFLGDALPQYLDGLKTGESVVFGNPWHAIALYKNEDGYQYYDPNSTQGVLAAAPQEIQALIQKSLGSLVMVIDNKPDIAPLISDYNDFLDNGGLLTLCKVQNYRAILAQFPFNLKFTSAALDGLMFISTSGNPAWLRALEMHRDPDIQNLAVEMLVQGYAMNHNAFIEAIERSVEALTPQRRHFCIVTLCQHLIDRHPRLCKKLIKAIAKAPTNKASIQNALATWHRKAHDPTSVSEYGQQMMRHDEHSRNRLIECADQETLHNLRDALADYGKHTNRPIFYVDSPKDLQCSAAHIQRAEDGTTGRITQGPGGPLHDFLATHAKGVILVNYSNFKPDDRVRFNSIFDAERRADGTIIPEETIIVALSELKNWGEDLSISSRLDEKHTNPFSAQALKTHCKPQKIPDVEAHAPISEASDSVVIDLFHQTHWRSTLLGRWRIQGDVLAFEEGALLKALKTGVKTLNIRNGPWQDEEFQDFWQQLQFTGIIIPGTHERLFLPEDVTLVRSDGIDWQPLQSALTTEEQQDMPRHPLNPLLLNQCFERYEQQDGSLFERPGMLEAAKANGENVLAFYLTRPLTQDGFAKLLTQCQQKGLQLNIECAPGVTVPEALADSVSYRESRAFLPFDLESLLESDAATLFVKSTDIDTTVAQITQHKPAHWQVIDVTGCSSSELLQRLKGTLNQDTARFEFEEREGALLQALKAGNNVLLKGEFSKDLIDALAPVLLEQQQKDIQAHSGKLVCISNQSAPFDFLNTVHDHNVQVIERLTSLIAPQSVEAFQEHEHELLEKLRPFLEEPLAKLKARYQYLCMHPEATSEETNNAWLGLDDLPSHVQMDTEIDFETVKEQSQRFHKQREQQVLDTLEYYPYAFLTGLTGTGKTTFVEKVLCSETSKNTLYAGENSLLAWANDKSKDGLKILFIDEVNLSHLNCNIFEGLAQTPPALLIDGTYIPLDDHHKVIFSGNPVSYGDERELAPVFERHGGTVLFDPLSPAVIYNDVLMPLMEQANLTPDEKHAICQNILEAYAFICQCSADEVLISPRELQIMVNLTLAHREKYEHIPTETLAAYFVEQIGKNLVPKANQAQFEERFKSEIVELNPEPFELPNVTETPSRRALIQRIDELLQLQKWRIEHQDTLSQQQQFAGTDSLILEGPPAAGKSFLAMNMLMAKGYEKIKNFSQPPEGDFNFYHLPVSMPVDEKIEALLYAFIYGAAVIIDEFNSSPMLERLLNDLLMGNAPDGIKPIRPGFMIIATQNPSTMAGRHEASNALKRRMLFKTLPEYPPEEIQTLLEAEGLKPNQAKQMTEIFVERQQYAQKNHLEPAPNFRDLLKVARKFHEASKESKVVYQAIMRTFKPAEEMDRTHPEINPENRPQ